SEAPRATSSSWSTCAPTAGRGPTSTSRRSSPTPAPGSGEVEVAVIALVVHRLRPEALRVAKNAVAWLTEQGHDIRLPRIDAEALDLVELGCEPEKLAAGLDLAVSLGGDGTILRT